MCIKNRLTFRCVNVPVFQHLWNITHTLAIPTYMYLSLQRSNLAEKDIPELKETVKSLLSQIDQLRSEVSAVSACSDPYNYHCLHE